MITTSSSNWLDRLRSSRGFPTGEEPDLDRFISLSSSSGSTESAAHVMREKTPQWTPPPGEFAAVLSDLFNMGGDQSSRSYSKKKASRKQPNPRFFCVDNDLPTSSDDLRRDRCDNGGFLSSGDNSFHEKRVINDNGNDNVNVNVRVDVDVEERDVGVDDNVDLKGFSRSEVTVIDTSFDEWKSDKWVFRKNDEWKIKEKKTRFKSRVCGGGGSKKRKLLDCSLGVNNNNNNNNKVDDDQLMKKKQKEEEQTNKKQPQIDETRVPVQKREAFLGKVRQKRFPCPRPPEKVRKEASPVILIKSIPLNDTSTNVATIKPRKSSLKKRPKQMKIN